MYEKLKKVFKSIVSEKFIFKNELVFRKIYANLYSGKTFECNICSRKLSRFALNSRNEKLCPNCGSLERDRKLWQLIETTYLKPEISILDFSPSRCLARKFKKIKDINYLSTDFCGNFIADHKFDITNLNLQDNSVDLICCYHILEHIKDDTLAMSELFRVLKNGGTALIQTPFKEGETYENEAVVTKEDRLLHFGQEDHVRIYSENDLARRLRKVGFEVVIRHFNYLSNNLNGFSENEIIIIAKKT